MYEAVKWTKKGLDGRNGLKWTEGKSVPGSKRESQGKSKKRPKEGAQKAKKTKRMWASLFLLFLPICGGFLSPNIVYRKSLSSTCLCDSIICENDFKTVIIKYLNEQITELDKQTPPVDAPTDSTPLKTIVFANTKHPLPTTTTPIEIGDKIDKTTTQTTTPNTSNEILIITSSVTPQDTLDSWLSLHPNAKVTHLMGESLGLYTTLPTKEGAEGGPQTEQPLFDEKGGED